MTEETLSSLGEFGLIRRYFAPLQFPLGAAGEVGIGDDAAVLSVPRTQQLLCTTDTLQEGVHFRTDADPYLLGQRALRVNLSDIAAMGGQPRWYLLSLALPPSTTLAWVEQLAAGLAKAGQEFQVSLVGGNTASCQGAIAITLTVLGVVGQNRAVTRKGAKAGDRLLVSGTIGDAALALARQLGRLAVADADGYAALERRLLLPEPRLALGALMQEAALLHAAIDVSDGLVADLRHICEASGVRAVVDAEKIPLSPSARGLLDRQGPDLWSLILAGGEDYELLMAVPEGGVDSVAAIAAAAGVPVAAIGVFQEGPPGAEVRLHGQPLAIRRPGWTHFY